MELMAGRPGVRPSVQESGGESRSFEKAELAQTWTLRTLVGCGPSEKRKLKRLNLVFASPREEDRFRRPKTRDEGMGCMVILTPPKAPA